MTKFTRATSFANSMRFAAAGIAWAFRTQRNVRIQVGIAAIVVAAALGMGIPLSQVTILVLAITIVLVAELLNSALEATVDLVSPEIHPLAQVAKDAAAGGVLLAAGGAATVGVLIFGARAYLLFSATGG